MRGVLPSIPPRSKKGLVTEDRRWRRINIQYPMSKSNFQVTAKGNGDAEKRLYPRSEVVIVPYVSLRFRCCDQVLTVSNITTASGPNISTGNHAAHTGAMSRYLQVYMNT